MVHVVSTQAERMITQCGMRG